MASRILSDRAQDAGDNLFGHIQGDWEAKRFAILQTPVSKVYPIVAVQPAGRAFIEFHQRTIFDMLDSMAGLIHGVRGSST